MKKSIVFIAMVSVWIWNACNTTANEAIIAEKKPFGLIGKWSGKFTKTGRMCGSGYGNPCNIPWERTDINQFEFLPDSTGANRYRYIRVNAKDSSESWDRTDSFKVSTHADSLVFLRFKMKYDEDTAWRLASDTVRFQYLISGDTLILKNYKMYDTAIFYQTDFRLKPD